jgi:prepilin-type N-terminal cleavage/methylation domain-containing protein
MIFPRGHARAKPRRRGFTLIEMMVVITAVATALGLCATTIQLLLRLKADAQSRFSANVGLERLARQLRSDAHAAAVALVDAPRGGKAASLRLEFGPKHGVAYEPRKSAVVRLESQDGNLTHREAYALEPATEVEFEIRPEAGRQFVAVVMRKRNAKGRTGASLVREALALVGKELGEPLGQHGGPPR